MRSEESHSLLYAAVVAGLLSIASSGDALGAENRTVVNAVDSGAVLVNPGMGWVLHHYDNSLTHYGSKLEPSVFGAWQE